jgi:hypothetical protein
MLCFAATGFGDALTVIAVPGGYADAGCKGTTTTAAKTLTSAATEKNPRFMGQL